MIHSRITQPILSKTVGLRHSAQLYCCASLTIVLDIVAVV